jgi:hypothetical protein
MRRALLLLGLLGCSAPSCSEAVVDRLADGRPANASRDAGLFRDAGAVADDATPDAVAPLAELVINEVAASGDPSDWFELCNRTDSPISLDGYTFTDDVLSRPGRAAFAAGLVVPARGYLQVFVSSDANGFGLGRDEELGIHTLDDVLVDAVDWADGDSPAGGSFARSPDCEGPFVIATTPTPAGANPS